jgi:heme/copper-type cytochrome/quinol oxidase subunit 3
VSSEITRSMEATSPVMSASVARARRSLPNGWWAVLLFVCSEATFFGVLISSYFYLRFQVAHWPPPGIEKPKVVLPLILTGVLVASVVPMAGAVRAAKLGRRGAALLLVVVAFVIQAAYLGVQMHEFLSDLDKVHPKASAYGSVYITLIGAHHLHVIAGLFMQAWLISRLAGGLTNYRLNGLRAISLYWYFVAAIAIPVVFTQIYPSL